MFSNYKVSFLHSLFFFLLFCFLVSTPASAQRFIGGIAVGMNFSMVDGDEVFETYSKVGFNGGPYIKLMLDNKQRFSITMELLYAQKGGQKKYPAPTGVRIALGDTALIDPYYPEENMKYFYRLRTDYLEIPLLVHFEDPRSKFGIGLGFAWSRLVYITEYEHDFRRFTLDTASSIRGARRLNTTINSGRYFKNDWSIVADVKIPIYKGLKANFRFQYSLVPFGIARQFFYSINPKDEHEFRIRKPFHNTLTFRIIYSFNEKYTENENYDWDGNRIGPQWIRDPNAMRW
ncbi:MAG: PorT family protein [Bacteroidales bacterium]|jgi:hypothetical protein|nr:PorT family protein [Bacteroidales bacterium]